MKEILVHLNGGRHTPARLERAIQIAQTEKAHLTGLFAQSDSDGPSMVARKPSRHLRDAAELMAATFQSATRQAGLSASWLELPHGEPGFVLAETVFCSRYADLVILGQTDAPDARVPEDLAERVVLESGRPVLILPQTEQPKPPIATFGTKIGVAWNASRESSRALHDALPFLQQAATVTILTIRPSGSITAPANLPQVDIVQHLAKHGITAKSDRIIDEDIGLMDALLLQSFQQGFDMLVMGAHNGLGVLRGAGTRFMLRHMTLPVLMSC